MEKRKEESILEYLERTSKYAIASKSRNLVYEAYGEAMMAYRLKALSWPEFSEINALLIRDTLNNGRLMTEWERERLGCNMCGYKKAALEAKKTKLSSVYGQTVHEEINFSSGKTIYPEV